MALPEEVGELPPHWVADAIATAVETKDASKVAQALGDFIASNDRFHSAIAEALIEPDPPVCGPSAKHRVLGAVAELLG